MVFSSLPSICAGLKVCMKSIVLAILVLSSAKVSSVSSCLGTSAPASRATAPFAESQAICTWRFIGSMSGYRRKWVKTTGSIFLASACACALSRTSERFLSVFAKRGTLAWYMEMVTAVSGDWTARRAFYRAATGEKKGAPPAGRTPRCLRANLLDELREDDDEPDDGHEPRERPQPGEPGEIDGRVADPAP